MGLFDKFKNSLTKSRESLGDKLNSVLAAFRAVDEDFLDELLEVLIMSDIGMDVAESIIDELRKEAKLRSLSTPEDIKALLVEIITKEMDGESELNISETPAVILMIGVNGTGKTTTSAKLAAYLKAQGKKVILAAADTFRAAASAQLAIWAERIGVDIVKHGEGGDPAAVVFDAISAAKARKADVIICDTAGRLHNKKHLMDELTKIRKVIDRELPKSSKEVFLVLDATTGQNALVQAKEFKDAADLTGIVLTKLDGTAKGGMAIGVLRMLGIPIKFVGLGEKVDDFEKFSPEDFARGLVE